MSQADWQLEGRAFVNCNCAWGCPCQFSSLPTTGQCEAVWAMHIDKGQFNGTRLDGLTWGVLIWWPGAVHEGNGKQQPLFEQRATTEQRRALETIVSGQASAEGTYFHIFATVAPHFQPAIAAEIEFDWDQQARHARLVIQNVVDARVEPIRNPMTQLEQRAQVALPGGFEYKQAEFASGVTRTQAQAAIDLDLKGTHAHLYHVAWNAEGVVAN